MKDHICTSESNNGSAGCDFTTIGLVHVNNTVVFVAGDRVFTRSPDQNVPTVKTDGTGFRLDVDESITLQEAFDGLSELISLVPGVGWVLLAHTISGIIREAFVKAGFTPDTVLMIVGKSGMLKSSYVPQITQLYNRNDGVRANTRFNSTKRFIEDSLFEYRDCTYVIDDIHTGSSASIKKINETTAEEIIRQISDNTGRGRKNGNELIQRCFEGNAVFIGEYIIGAESTLPRVLFVEITEKPDSKILDKFQRGKKLLMSTFYSYFIQWYVDKFDDIMVVLVVQQCGIICPLRLWSASTDLKKFRSKTLTRSSLYAATTTKTRLFTATRRIYRACGKGRYTLAKWMIKSMWSCLMCLRKAVQ